MLPHPRLACLVLALALAALGPAATAPAARMRVVNDGFVLAGQSNMVGRSTQYENQKTGRVTSPAPNGLKSWTYRAQTDNNWSIANEFPCDDSQCVGTNCTYPGLNRTVDFHPQWVDSGNGTCVCACGVHTVTSNQDADAGRGSAWPTFAELWMQRGHQAWFVGTALGGQCLVGTLTPVQPAWDPDALDCSQLTPIQMGQPSPSLQSPGELYCRMIQAVHTSGIQDLRAVLWLQGECDATAGVSYTAYKAALEHLADRIWADLGVPMIAAPISRHTLTTDSCPMYPQINAIAQATIDAAAEHPRIYPGPNSDALPLESDCIHIHDVQTLGQRWVQAVLNAGVAP